MFVTSLDIYKIVFMAELLIAEGMFVIKLHRRSFFVLRAIIAAVVCLVTAVFVPVFAYNAAYTSLLFLAFFALTLLAVKFCFAESWYNVFFCSIAAYTVQHFAYELFNYVSSVTGIGTAYSDNIYSDVAPVIPNGYTVILYLGVYGFVYWIMYFIFGDRIRKTEEMTLKGWWMLFLAAMIVLVDVVFNAIAVYEWNSDPNIVYRTIIFLYNITCCPLALIVQFGLLSRKNLENELRAVYGIRRSEQQQYRISKESIALINRKCHDIKFQLRRYGTGIRLGSEAIKDFEEAVSIYDTSVKTGNVALDTILSEKKLYCRMNNIKFTCMADGASLSFMREVDIYSLFGNILENAIEAVENLSEENKIVGLVVKKERDMIIVSAYNYYKGEIKMKDGLPVSTKGDAINHGYGMSSIRAITDEYGGSVSIAADDGIFRLTIMVPAGACKKDELENSEGTGKAKNISSKRAKLLVIPPCVITAVVSVGLFIVANYNAATLLP